jgi:hypothetical protein
MNAEPAQMVPVSRWIGGRIAADDSAHRRIMTQPFGVVHILVSSEAIVKLRATICLFAFASPLAGFKSAPLIRRSHAFRIAPAVVVTWRPEWRASRR